MNRIILIGNGFDLAHDLETSYRHFIDNYWGKKVEQIAQTKRIPNNNGIINDFGMCIYEDDDIQITIKLPLDNTPDSTPIHKEISCFLEKENAQLKYKNKFLEQIMYGYNKKNWVDIEDEYYKALKKCIENKDKNNDEVNKLNQVFSVIKKALEEYLKETINTKNQKYNDKIQNNIFSHFDLKDFIDKGVEDIVKCEYQKITKLRNSKKQLSTIDLSETTLVLLQQLKNIEIDEVIFKKFIFKEENASNFHLIPKQFLFLNFNYTNTENEYYEYDLFKNKTDGYKAEMKNIEKQVIHIHGELKSEGNPIIFGYGDEIDDAYKTIETINDNRFLENIKSIRYLETDNYKKVLNFINSDFYQIYIMGHSCGISDRTLLSTLFEHDNCVSIKIFYHQKGDDTDNYSDIVRNISRNFANKTIMREKVVNKQYCLPLL